MGSKTFSMDPDTIVLRTLAKNESKKQTAVESSPAAYQNYVFWADGAGVLRCVDMNSLTVAWAVETGDAVEASIALDLEGDQLWLYTANTLQNRKKGSIQIRRYNALTGEEDWVRDIGVTKTKSGTPIAGVVASPAVGTGALSDLVFFTVSGLSADASSGLTGSAEAEKGVLVALEKATGKVRWTYSLDSYSYSSPVAVYNAEGRGWIIQASSSGTLSLLDGQSGSLQASLLLDGTINASPAVYNSILVIGTQGKGTSHIYGISLD